MKNKTKWQLFLVTGLVVLLAGSVVACGEPTPSVVDDVCTLDTAVYPSGAGSVEPSGGTYARGTSVTLTANAYSGYEFSHWSRDASGSYSTYVITMDDDRYVVAVFIPQEAPPETTTLLADSFSMIARPFSEDAALDCWQKYFETDLDEAYEEFLSTVELPFCDCGIYCSDSFYLMADETVDIVVESEIPPSEEFDFCIMHGYGIERDICDVASWFEGWDTRRHGNAWETTVTFHPDKAGRYQLQFVNTSGRPLWCEYTVSLIE